MPDENPSPADLRRSRLLCFVAAGVFTACGLLLLGTTLDIAIRLVGAGFNFVVATAVCLYARTFRPEQ